MRRSEAHRTTSGNETKARMLPELPAVTVSSYHIQKTCKQAQLGTLHCMYGMGHVDNVFHHSSPPGQLAK